MAEIARLRTEAAEHRARAEALRQGQDGAAARRARAEGKEAMDAAEHLADAAGWVRSAVAASGVAAEGTPSLFRRPLPGSRAGSLPDGGPTRHGGAPGGDDMEDGVESLGAWEAGEAWPLEGARHSEP